MTFCTHCPVTPLGHHLKFGLLVCVSWACLLSLSCCHFKGQLMFTLEVGACRGSWSRVSLKHYPTEVLWKGGNRVQVGEVAVVTEPNTCEMKKYLHSLPSLYPTSLLHANTRSLFQWKSNNSNIYRGMKACFHYSLVAMQSEFTQAGISSSLLNFPPLSAF